MPTHGTDVSPNLDVGAQIGKEQGMDAWDVLGQAPVCTTSFINVPNIAELNADPIYEVNFVDAEEVSHAAINSTAAGM